MAKWECIKSRAFDGDIVITDPCYLRHGGESRALQGCESWEGWVKRHGGMINRTYYGDWGCTVFAGGKKAGSIPKGAQVLGEFCADAGMVCVVGLDHVRLESPGFEKWLEEHSWCGTVIKGFKGVVKFITKTTPQSFRDRNGDVHEYKDTELHVRGDGEIGGKPASFESLQTSL